MASPSRPTADRYLESVENDVRTFAAAARKGLDAPVPTCPGWTVRDLLVHTGVIYRRKQLVIEQGLTDRETSVEEPDSDEIAWFEESAALMLTAFRSRGASDSAWTWHPPDQTVGFWFRRMAHESLVHRVDAELSHGAVSDIDPVIAGDGIDEALEVFIAGYPGWATLDRGDSSIRLKSPGRSWSLRKGSFSGTTRSGKVLTDRPVVLLEPDAPASDCEISGSAAALDLWLWGRGSASELEITGDRKLADYLRNVAAQST